MNGQSTNMPPWLNLGLKLVGLIIAGVLAFSTLSARVNAVDIKVDNEISNTNRVAQSNTLSISQHNEQIREIRETQIKVTTVLDSINDSLKEIKQDNKDIKKELREHSDIP